jgi:hypothetical protein
MAQLKVYQIDHYRSKIREMIDPIKRLLDLKLDEKKEIVKSKIESKLKSTFKIEKWKKTIKSFDDKLDKLESDYRKMREALKNQQLTESNKLRKVFYKNGVQNYNLPDMSEVFDDYKINSCFESVVDKITNDKCKTMDEFKEINKLNHVQSCMNDVLYEEGSSEGMNKRLDEILKSSLGITFRRDQALQLTKQ